MQTLVEKYVPQKWNNVRSIHIKGPNTAALPIWLAEELWEDENDILDEAPVAIERSKGKKRKRGALVDAAAQDDGEEEVIMVPGGDGKMRRLKKPFEKVMKKLLPWQRSLSDGRQRDVTSLIQSCQATDQHYALPLLLSPHWLRFSHGPSSLRARKQRRKR